MEQLSLPFTETNENMVKRVFQEMLGINPHNNRYYDENHMLGWLNQNPRNELYTDSQGDICSRRRETR